MTIVQQVALRAAHEGDMGYVYGSWVAAHKRTRPHVPWSLHAADLNRRIDCLIKRGAQVAVACDPECSNLIFGWVCFERFAGEDRSESTAVHWLNTKRPYRRLGVAKLLLDHIGVDVTEPIIASDASYIVHVLRDRYTVTVVPQLLDGLGL